MIKLKDLITEQEEPTDSDQWESWYDYIDYFEYDIEKSEISKLVKRFTLNWKGYFKNKIVKIFDNKNTLYFEYDASGETFSWIKDILQWVYDNGDSLGIDPAIIYNGHVESTLKDVRENPGKVYHWTTEEKWEEIQQSGGMHGSSGTGINNRGAHGIFTSTDPEEYQLGTYGDICLEIDLDKFKQESGLKALNLDFEPEVEEYLMRDYIMSTLEIENRDDIPSDISPYTIIIGHNIPLKYIKQI